MKMSYLKIGKIVGSHGLKGMVRIECWCDSPEFLCSFKRLFTSENNEAVLKIEKASPHKNIALVKLKGVDTIEQAESMRGTVLYIFRDDAKLEEGRYFIEEIIGCNVYDVNTDTLYGKITDISPTGANDIWHIDCQGKEVLFPSVPHFVSSVDLDEGRLYIVAPKGLCDDED